MLSHVCSGVLDKGSGDTIEKMGRTFVSPGCVSCNYNERFIYSVDTYVILTVISESLSIKIYLKPFSS